MTYNTIHLLCIDFNVKQDFDEQTNFRTDLKKDTSASI